MAADGVTQREIARRLGSSPSSTRRACSSACRTPRRGPARRAGAIEQFLETLPEAEVSLATTPPAPAQRIRHATFPLVKTLEDFDFSAQPGAEKPLILHLAQLAWITERSNVCFIAPPGTSKTLLAIALAIKPARTGSACVRPAQQWVERLEQAQHHRNALDDELRRLERDHLLVVDEIGYLPRAPGSQPAVASVARRYERGSIIVTSSAASRPGARSSGTPWSPPH